MKRQIKKYISFLGLQILGGLFFTFLLFFYQFQVDANALSWDYFLVYNNFLTVFLIILPVFWMPNSKARKIYFALLLFLSFCQYIYFSYYKAHFGSFQIWYFFVYFFEILPVLSTQNLIKDFFYLGIFGFVLFYFFVQIEKKYRFLFFKFQFLPYLSCFGFLFFSFQLFWHARTLGIHADQYKHSLRVSFESIASFFGFVIPSQMGYFQTKLPLIATPKPSTEKKDFNIILVMGESLNTDYLSIFDPNATTHLAKKIQESNRFTVKKTLANGLATHPSLLRFFNLLNRPTHYQQCFSQNTSLFKLAKQQGFYTYFISTQAERDFLHIYDLLGKDFIDHTSMSHFLEQKYDQYLVESLQKIDLTQKNQFIILHHLAAHEVYKENIPIDFENTIDHDYARAVAYVEKIWLDIIEIIEKSQTPTYLIFTADHGEADGLEERPKGHCFYHPQVAIVPFLYASYNIENDPYHKILDQNMLFPPETGSKIIADILGYPQKLNFSNTYLSTLGITNPIGLDGFWELEIEKEQIKNAIFKEKYTDLNLEFLEQNNELTAN